MTMSKTQQPIPTLETLCTEMTQADVFSQVVVEDDRSRVVCQAKGPESEALYRAEWSPDGWVISLVTPDRWLSESIEAELVHTGDSIEELIEEELIDLGVDPDVVRVEHFRSDDMLYTFQTPLTPASQNDACTWLLAYEATFRVLGDMTVEDED
jgi:hypothetical protein